MLKMNDVYLKFLLRGYLTKLSLCILKCKRRLIFYVVALLGTIIFIFEVFAEVFHEINSTGSENKTNLGFDW